MAQALGGKVMPAQQGWGIGIRQSTTLTEEAHKYFPKGIMELHYNHHDQVLTLPEGAVCFATSSFCPVEGFTIGNHILTFQGHPEYTTAYNRHLLMNHAENEPMDVRTAALESFSHLNNMGTEAARWILTHHKKA
ncbi:MAG: hypothetical protein LUD02_14795 [Tannerellaceae bacterium]|nr:hypothetical protein [Tannerellaceae bacterium]